MKIAGFDGESVKKGENPCFVLIAGRKFQVKLIIANSAAIRSNNIKFKLWMQAREVR